MKSKSENLIYIYDSDRQKIIVIDSETGEEVAEKDDRVTSILKYLQEKGETNKLRKFSVWCAHQTNEKIKPIQNKILELAEKAIETEVENEKLAELYEETEGTAVAADTVGLRQGSKSAPAYLAVRECINPDALEGAIQSARFHRMWVEMNEGEDDDNENSTKDMPGLKEVSAKATKNTIQEAEQQQVDFLLDLINE